METKDPDRSPNSPLDSSLSVQIPSGSHNSATIASPDRVLPPPAENLDNWKPIEHEHSTDASSSSGESDAFMNSDNDNSLPIPLYSPVSRFNNYPLYHSYDREYYPLYYTPGRLSPYDRCFMYSREITQTGVGAGLSNLGNTCFINAILQCFTHTVPLVEELRSLNHSRLSENCVEGFCVLCAISEHVELALSSSGEVISPDKLVRNIHHISSNFERDQQEDAHEFLQCLLDKLELCFESKPNYQGFSSSPTNFVKKVFGGLLLSKLQCCSCGYCSYTYEPLIDLSLEIENVDTLPSALESFTKMEKITNFKCLSCKEEVSMEKQLMVAQAPSVATFHLKRFKSNYSYVEKIDKHVEFPLELDLQQYTSGSHEDDVTLKYKLYAVVVHRGYFSTSGHYFCFVRSAPDTWHGLNDSKVKRVSEDIVLSQDAYILFYARQGTPWFSSLMGGEKPCFDWEISPKSVVDNADSIVHPNAADFDSHVYNEYRYDAGVSVEFDDAEEVSAEFSYETTRHAMLVNVTTDAAKVTSQLTYGSNTEAVVGCRNGSSVADTSPPLEACSNYDNISCNTMDMRWTTSLGENDSKTSGKATDDKIFGTKPISRNSDDSVDPKGEYHIPSDDMKLADKNTCRRTLNKAMESEGAREPHRLIKRSLSRWKWIDMFSVAMGRHQYVRNRKKRRMTLSRKNKACSHRLHRQTRHFSVRNPGASARFCQTVGSQNSSC